MRAARQQDPQVVAAAYRHVEALVLSLDGLQPEKGHETLSVVRELNAKRIWCAEAWLSSNADEVRRLVSQARAWATQVGLPVHLWLSDKHDAFVTGIAAEFPGVPHRYCVNHCLRDLAKPMLETERHAKVKMRRTVRGLRAIERAILPQRQLIVAEAPAVAPVTVPPVPPPPANPLATDIPVVTEPPTDAGEVVLDDWRAVRGMLHDDQGGAVPTARLPHGGGLGRRPCVAPTPPRCPSWRPRAHPTPALGRMYRPRWGRGAGSTPCRPSATARDRACRRDADLCERFGHGAAGRGHGAPRVASRSRRPLCRR